MGQLWIINMLNMRHYHPVLLVKSLIDKIWSNESSNTENTASLVLLKWRSSLFYDFIRSYCLANCLLDKLHQLNLHDWSRRLHTDFSLPTFTNTYLYGHGFHSEVFMSQQYMEKHLFHEISWDFIGKIVHITSPAKPLDSGFKLFMINFECLFSVSVVWTRRRTMRKSLNAK